MSAIRICTIGPGHAIKTNRGRSFGLGFLVLASLEIFFELAFRRKLTFFEEMSLGTKLCYSKIQLFSLVNQFI